MNARLPRWGVLFAALLLAGLLTAGEKGPEAPPLPPQPWKKAPLDFQRAVPSPDGRVLAVFTRGSDEHVILYDLATGKELRRIASKLHCSRHLLAFTPDSKRLLTHRARELTARGAIVSYEAHVWDVATGKQVRKFDLLRWQGTYAASDKVLVAGGLNEVGTVYNLETGKSMGDLRPHTSKHRPKMLALSPDGRWLLSAGHDNSLCVWDVPARKLMHTLYEHTTRVEAIAISPDGAWCASITKEMRVWVFDRAKGTERARTDALLLAVTPNGLMFTPDGKTLVATGDGANHGLSVWDWQACRQPRGGSSYQQQIGLRAAASCDNPDPKWRLGGMTALGMLRSGQLLAHGGKGRLYFWDLAVPKPARPPRPPAPPPSPCPK